MLDTPIEGFPLSPQQRRLWSLSQGDDGFPYRALCQVLIAGRLDGERLRRAVDDTVRAHEILRTAFTPVAGLTFPLQVIADFPAAWCEDRDLSGLGERERQAALDELFEELGSGPVDLTDGPLLRLALARLEPERHALVVGLPALCADAPGLASLLHAIGRRYAVPGHTDEPLQYADLAAWQNDLLESAEARDSAAFWRARADALAGAPVPFEQVALPETAFRPRSLEVPLSPQVAADLATVARVQGASVWGLLLAAWRALLWRMTGGAPGGVAVAADGRDGELLADVVGLLSKRLPVPLHVSGREPFHALLARAEKAVHEGVEAQASFSWEGPSGVGGDGSADCFPLGYELDTLPAWEEAGLAWQVVRQRVHTDRCGLRLIGQADGHGAGLRASIDFDAARFRAEDVSLLAEQLQTLLGHVATDPDAPVERLRLLSDSERQRLVVAFNATATEAPAQTFPELFAEQAARTPEALAVTGGSDFLSYAALDRRANQLAHRLRTLGVGAETPVAVVMERSAELLVAILGVLKAGGAFLPLDPSHPTRRLAFMLDDARPPVILIQEPLVARLPEHRAQVLCLDASGLSLAGEPDLPPPARRSPDQIAYVIYTSGSTGRPKGVLVTQRGLVNYLTWANREYAVSHGRGAPVDSSIAVDLTITGLLAPLLTGRTVVLVNERQSVEGLTDVLLASSNFSFVKLTPLQLDLLSAWPAAAEVGRRTRAFIIGGENLLADSVAFWRQHAPDTRLVNEYGPTETVVGCCTYTVAADSPTTGSVPIGRPIANLRLYALDAAMEPVPVGVPGEIYIGGAGVARGYLGRPGLTAERFVPDPFSPAPGGRLYRTGDLGRFLSDGNLEYLGRNDHQVKIRGHRVEPGEVEAALRRHPGVRGSVVTAHEFGAHDRRLVAYVVTDESTRANELRGFLAECLPAHMVPSLFVPLDALPVSAGGKVDRGRLPDPQPNQLGQEREYVAARTSLEKEIAQLFGEVLHLDRVGLHDNFFDLGGTSILLVEVNNRLAHVYGMDRNLTQMLQAPTVAATAQMIAATQEQGREAVLAAGTVRAEVDAHLDASINPDWSMTDPAAAR
jgi:amino acid adenylation domain-containing protein